MALHVLGVRHHSPACARRVGEAIRRLRPRHVLIEGPADFNARIDELRLGHDMPVALFTYYRSDERTWSCWTPFCRSSPEWEAIEAGSDVQAQIRFMDLPAWHKAFLGVRNRYADSKDRSESFVQRLCEKVGVDDSDTLWDHLFEQPEEPQVLGQRLDAYFRMLRGEADAGDRDGPREAYMARCVAWALADAQVHGGDVVVVCGGWHQPPLEKVTADPKISDSYPEVESPDEGEARYGTYLVPYSFHRLDAFTGYEAGLPSPGWYDALWESGPEKAGDLLLISVVERLRKRKQLVSTADLIACMSAAQGLGRLRGHTALTRTDLLDGIAVALVKDGLEVPLPWSRRGTLLARTDPLLVEVIKIFSGDKEGKLAIGTPRPPLLFDAEEQLRQSDLEPPRHKRDVRFRLTKPEDREKSRLLHRLRVLKIPGFTRTHGPSTAIDAELEEQWTIVREDPAESALIEASAWGATLETAATRYLEEALLITQELDKKVALLTDAVFVGVQGLAQKVMQEVAQQIHKEPQFSVVGHALTEVLAVWRHGELLGAAGASQLGVILEAAYDRALWLLEGIQGPTAPADEGTVQAMVAIRDTTHFGLHTSGPKLNLPSVRAHGVMMRRAVDDQAPPAVRGGALGYLWNAGEWANPEEAEGHAADAMRGSAQPQVLGDFLVGLFALAREEVISAPSLLTTLDELIKDFDLDAFLIALPSLRLAFTWFPPRERRRIAESVVSLYGKDSRSARSLTDRLTISPQEVVRGAQIDRAVHDRAATYGLLDSQEDT